MPEASRSESLRPGFVDAALALFFAVAASAEVWLTDVGSPPEAKLVASLLTTLPLAWRSTAPVATTAVSAGAYAVAVALGLGPDDSAIPVMAPLLAVYSVGARGGARPVAAAVVLALGPLTAAVAASGAEASEVLIFAGAVVTALVVGAAVKALGFEVDVLQSRAAQLERERDETARAAVAEERARIARELHDVIGHSIALMGVQAGAVRRRLSPDQEREREVLLAVERTGRDAVGEMRRLLGFLRAGDDTASLDAMPTIQRIDELVEDMRRAGLEVDVQVDGDLGDLSPGRALAAFRILQEAVTNAFKHARGSRVRASLRRTPGQLEIEVVDDGSAVTAPAEAGGGHGLVGMRERVGMYGGTLSAGPSAGGGFQVLARLPTEGS